MNDHIQQLRAALLLARPYVRVAAERPCFDKIAERKRAEAAEKLRKIDAALAATPGVAAVHPSEVTEAMKRAGVREMMDAKPDEAWEERVARVYLAMRAAGACSKCLGTRYLLDQPCNACGAEDRKP